MSIQIKKIIPNESCFGLEGYKLGFNDAYLQMVDQVNSLLNMKEEYDRAFCIIRHAGITKQETKKLSTALNLLLNKHHTAILLLNKKNVDNSTELQDVKRGEIFYCNKDETLMACAARMGAAEVKNATGQHVPIINPHLVGIENS